MEKIRSGQSFLYRENGLNSTVLDTRMVDKVKGSYLQRALMITLKRFPYMAQKFIEKNGDFFLEESYIGMVVCNTKKLRKLGSMSTGYHLVDVTYWDNSIRIAFHHGLCDGRGITPFLESLLYYYCQLRYKRPFTSKGIRLANEQMFSDERAEPIGKFMYDVNENNLPKVEKDGFVLPYYEDGEQMQGDKAYRYEINIDKEDFLKYMKETGATPGILLSKLISKSISKVFPDTEKPIVCSMAFDFRKEIGLDNTHKNCVGSLYLPYTKEIDEMSENDKSKLYRKILTEQRQEDNVKNMINMQVGLYNKVDEFNSIKEKQKALGFFNDLRIDTYVISYLGQIELGDRVKYVESIHLYNSGVSGLRVNMICASNCFTIDFIQDFESEDIINTLINEIENIGLDYSFSERIEFETTKDKTFITASKHPTVKSDYLFSQFKSKII